MRVRAALLVTAFAILVVVASVTVTSHLGVRDWPTPPMPDTATRLITPTEVAGRGRDRVADKGDERSVRTVAAAVAVPAARPERVSREGGSQPAHTRPAVRTRRTSVRRPAALNNGRRHTSSAPATPQPVSSTDRGSRTQSTPAPDPAPAAPVAQANAGSGDGSQARPQDVVPQAAAPAVPAVPVPAVPTASALTGDSGHDGDHYEGHYGDHYEGDDDGGHDHYRGAPHDLLDGDS